MNAIVLAAGLSKRMGAQKLLLPFGGTTVIETVLRQVLGASFGRVVAVVSAETVPAALSVRQGEPRLLVVVNEAPEQGQSSSLRLGVGALSGLEEQTKNAPFCVTLGDLPLVTSEQFDRYKKNFFEACSRETGCTAFVPRRGDVTGHPVFFAHQWAARLSGGQGDAGGRGALRAFSGEICWTQGEDAFFRDMDTPAEYREILHKNLQ